MGLHHAFTLAHSFAVCCCCVNRVHREITLCLFFPFISCSRTQSTFYITHLRNFCFENSRDERCWRQSQFARCTYVFCMPQAPEQRNRTRNQQMNTEHKNTQRKSVKDCAIISQCQSWNGAFGDYCITVLGRITFGFWVLNHRSSLLSGNRRMPSTLPTSLRLSSGANWFQQLLTVSCSFLSTLCSRATICWCCCQRFWNASHIITLFIVANAISGRRLNEALFAGTCVHACLSWSGN